MKGTNKTWYEIVVSPAEVEEESVEGFELKNAKEAAKYLADLLELALEQYPKNLDEWGRPDFQIYKWVNKEEGEDPCPYDIEDIDCLPKYVQKMIKPILTVHQEYSINNQRGNHDN